MYLETKLCQLQNICTSICCSIGTWEPLYRRPDHDGPAAAGQPRAEASAGVQKYDLPVRILPADLHPKKQKSWLLNVIFKKADLLQQLYALAD